MILSVIGLIVTAPVEALVWRRERLRRYGARFASSIVQSMTPQAN